MTNETRMSSQELLLKMILGGWVQQSISVAAKLGLPDLLKESPKSYQELAEETNTHAPALFRLLRALSSVGLFNELDNKQFEIGPLGRYLLSGEEGSVLGMAIMVGEKWHRDAWSNLLYSVQTGETAFYHVHGKGFFDYVSENPEAGEIFNNAMSALSNIIAPVVNSYDFSVFERIIDVGGGHGRLMEAILMKYQHVKGTVFDLPTVIEGTKRSIQSAGLDNRCNCIAGSFFDSIPSGGDAYVMKQIIHDWNDEEAITILQNCRKGIHKNGKILLLEALIQPGNGPDPTKFVDIEMMVQATGKERTETEFRELFEKAGFILTEIIPTKTHLSIIEGAPF